MNVLVSLLVVTILLLTSGCQENEQPLEEVFPFPAQNGNPNANLNDPVVQNLVQLATDDLTKKLNINQNQIRLSSAKSVNWPDSSLGCPQLGISYLPVITPGYILILEVDGNSYSYQTDNKDRVILCELNSEGDSPILPSS